TQGNEPKSVPAPARLESDSVSVLNRWLPLELLAQTAKSEQMPAELRDELAVRTWLRAAILDDRPIERILSPNVKAAYPELRTLIQGYEDADSPEARRFVLVFMIMQFPGMVPYVNAGPMGSTVASGFSSYDSWWCFDVGSDVEHRPYQSRENGRAAG